MSFGSNLKSARERVGLTQANIGELFDISSQAVSQWERDETAPELEKLPTLAKALKVSQAWLLGEESAAVDPDRPKGPPTVRVVGYVGADPDGAAHFYQFAQDQYFDRVPALPESTEKTVAVEIRGDSMGKTLDRGFAYYDDVRRPVDAAALGRVCVVGLADGRVLLKRVRQGSKKGLFQLVSDFAPPIEDVRIEWAAPAITKARG